MAAHSILRVDKPWGYELIWARTERYAGKILHVRKGMRLSLQYHREKEETLYVQAGVIELQVGQGSDAVQQQLVAGQGCHLAPRTIHRLTALEDADVLEVSSPELDDVVRLEDDHGRC